VRSLAWVCALYDDAGVLVERGASDDLSESLAAGVFVGAIPERRLRNADAIRVTEEMPTGGGVDAPQTVTLEWELDGWSTPNPTEIDWRRYRARLVRYDRDTGSLAYVFDGVVSEVVWTGVGAEMTLASYDQSILRTPIPRTIVNVDEFPSALDVGAAIPVPFGTAYISAPVCGVHDPDSEEITAVDPGGTDYLLADIHDADGALIDLEVQQAWWDLTPGTAELELATSWNPAPGTAFTPTANPSTFEVTGTQLDAVYVAAVFGGTPIRFKTTASAGAWITTHVIAFYPGSTPGGTGTVQVGDNVVGAGLSDVELLGGADYFVERGRYTNAGGSLASLRFFAVEAGTVVARVHRPLQNPARVIEEILRNPVWGLGQTVNAASFAAAESEFAAAGLDAAVNGALGGDRQQRPAVDVLNELLALRGARLRYLPTGGGAWTITVDSNAVSPTVTLGYGDGLHQNIVSFRGRRRSPLPNAVGRLTMRYGHRVKASHVRDVGAQLTPLNDARFQLHVDVLGWAASDVVVTSSWLAGTASAGRVAYYMARRMAAGDEVIDLTCYAEDVESVSVGHLVTIVAPDAGVDGAYRVLRIERGLLTADLTVEGYDANAYTYDPDAIGYDGDGAQTQADADTTDVRTRVPGAGVNLVVNPDFTAGVRSTDLAARVSSDAARSAIPGWWLEGVVDAAWSVTRNTDVARGCYGTAYLTANPDTSTSKVRAFMTSDPTVASARTGIACPPRALFLVSLYTDQTEGWRFIYACYDSAGLALHADWEAPPIRVDPNDRNGNGWKRHYAILRTPTDAATLVIGWELTGLTMRVDAVQLEAVGRHQHKPSHWHRSPRWGVDPAVLQPGDVTVRASNAVAHGTTLGHYSATVLLIGGTTRAVAGAHPANSVITQVTGRVTTAITGATKWSLGTPTDPDAWGLDLSPAAGTVIGANDGTVLSPVNLYAPTDLVFTGDAAFTGGVVEVTIHYYLLTPPDA